MLEIRNARNTFSGTSKACSVETLEPRLLFVAGEVWLSHLMNAQEGAADPRAVIEVMRNGDLQSQTITVNYSVSGTAVSGLDYQALSGSITIPAFQDDNYINIWSINDIVAESTETVVIAIESGSYTIGNPSSVTAYIADNGDTHPEVTITALDGMAAETDSEEESANNGVFRISRSGPTSQALNVGYTLGGTATNGSDYDTLSGAVTISSGAAYSDVVIAPIWDGVAEGNETATATLNSSAGYQIGGDGNASITLQNKVKYTITVSESPVEINNSDPGHPITMMLYADGELDTTTAVTTQIAGGVAGDGASQPGAPNGAGVRTVTITSGAAPGPRTFGIVFKVGGSTVRTIFVNVDS